MSDNFRQLNKALLIAITIAGMAAQAWSADKAPARKVFYETSVVDIVKTRCVKCHNTKQNDGGLDLSSPEGIVAGSDSGPIIDSDQPDTSILLERVTSNEMPPEGEMPLTDVQKMTVREWIESGAQFRKPPRRRQVSEHDVIPVLLLRCTACHGTRLQEGELDLRTRESILKGGTSGRVVVSGDPKKSLLIQRIHKEEMPPRRKLVSVSVKPMTASELKTLEAWIQAGLPPADRNRPGNSNANATFSDQAKSFWAFQPPRAKPVPSGSIELDNPIDAFVAEKLAKRGLAFAPAADRLTLLRRVYFDLTGLPPSPAEMDEFLVNSDPNAWNGLIERLLASPRYGERWARHWLDAAGYADSEGAQNEDRVRPHMWRYRDYVIRSFNVDKPYDQFLHEQIAGDELVDYSSDNITSDIYDKLVATGLLRTTPDRTFANITNFVPDRLEVIADEMQVFSSAILGLTLQCARCHDHKFDPLPQRDYYSLTAIFKDAYDEHDWLKSQGPRTLPHVTSIERKKWLNKVQEIDEQIKTFQKQIDAESNEEKRGELKKKVAELTASKPPEPRIRALWSRGNPSPTYLLRRGNYLTPGPPVEPGIPTALTPRGFTFRPASVSKGPATGRRLALAQWLTEPRHPLTARVFVNRIWKHHFGRGIVASVDNFGTTGDQPSHPELLDWLATSFVQHNWSIKWLHRQILTSRTWQQSSQVPGASDPSASALTEEERVAFLYGAPLRRMEAEVIRDTLLSISGQLDLSPYGPADGVTERSDGLITSARTDAGWRRSIYVLQRRTKVPTLLENFDSPQMGPNCLERSEATVAPQALHMLNNEMIHDLAHYFADRIIDRVGHGTASQVRETYRLALSRPPTSEEERLAIESMTDLWKFWRRTAGSTDDSASRNALASFCHAVMNSAGFLYID